MKSCENCKCGYWQMCDNEYGKYPEVLCHLHENCCGDEPYRIYEEEWVETAERCKEYTDKKTIEETHRVAEEYKQELEDRWKVTKQKAQGVLAEMLKNMDPESLERTRQEMLRQVRYNKTFEEAQEFLEKRGFDIPWNDCDVWVDKDKLTETVANVIQWADDTMIKKVCEWLYEHLYTRRDEHDPANHFVCSKEEMLTQTEFVEQLKKAIQ